MSALLHEHSRLIRHRSRLIRDRALETRAKSLLINGHALRIATAARAAQVERYVSGARRRVAGGSGAVDDVLPPFARAAAQEITPVLSTLWLRVETMLAEYRDGEPPADIVGELSVLSRLAGQMVGIVKGLAAFGAGASLEVGPVDLNAFLAEALPPVISRVTRNGVTLRPNHGRAVGPILADVEALRYVLTSLVETVAETTTTVDITIRSGDNGGVQLDVGNAQRPGALRAVTSRDALRLVLADAIMRNFNGTLERHVGNPVTTFTLSFPAAGQNR
jgi:hypothetical protein